MTSLAGRPLSGPRDLTDRAAAESDAPALAQLEVQALRARRAASGAWSPARGLYWRLVERWERRLARGDAWSLGRWEHGAPQAIVAYGIERGHDDRRVDDIAELWSLTVDADRWGSGIASVMLLHAIESMRDAGYRRAAAWVMPDDERALGFYRSRGWQHTDERRPSDVLEDVELARLWLDLDN